MALKQIEKSEWAVLHGLVEREIVVLDGRIMQLHEEVSAWQDEPQSLFSSDLQEAEDDLREALIERQKLERLSDKLYVRKWGKR